MNSHKETFINYDALRVPLTCMQILKGEESNRTSNSEMNGGRFNFVLHSKKTRLMIYYLVV